MKPFLLATLALALSACVVYTNNGPAPEVAKNEAAAKPKAKRKPKPEASEPVAQAKPKQDKPKQDKPKQDKPKQDKPSPKPVTPVASKPAAPQPTAADEGDKNASADKPAKSDSTLTQIVVPIRVPFAQLVTQIDGLLEKKASANWTKVSKGDSSPKVEVKYTLWRDAISATFDDQTLRVTVPVHYAANVRAQVKNPLAKDGWTWVTKGETWGTKAEPQQLTATFHSKIGVSSDYSLEADPKLDELKHGKPPSGDVCIKALAKICVSKESLAPMVEKHIDGYLRPKIQKMLDEASKQIDQSLHLKSSVQELWAQLQKPQVLQAVAQHDCPTELGAAACSKRAWLVAQPTAIGVNGPRLEGTDLAADIALMGYVLVVIGDPPPMTAQPLPKLSPVTDPAGFRVVAVLRMAAKDLSAKLSKELAGDKIGDSGGTQITVKAVAVTELATDKKKPRFTLVVDVSGGLDGQLKLSGQLAYDEKSRTLSASKLDFSVETKNGALTRLTDAEKKTLLAKLEKKARWELSPMLAPLEHGLESVLGGVLPRTGATQPLLVSVQLSKIALSGIATDGDAVSATAALEGKIAVGTHP